MPFIRNRRAWEMSENLATPQSVYLNRRKFIAALGLGALSLAAIGCGDRSDKQTPVATPDAPPTTGPVAGYPAKRNPAYTLDRDITDEKTAATYNNYYEFTTDKPRVAELARGFKARPWTIDVAGLVKKPFTIGFDDLLAKFDLEERLYRHRCVEAWSMAVPWTGFPLAKLIDHCQPLASAKFVRFVSVNRPDEMPGQKKEAYYPWPYFEALTIAEATNELPLVVTGVYGHPIPNQHGAPLRIAVPWKYGYKSPKAIVRIEFVEQQPSTFWSQLQPAEYPFESNVDPEIPHPRWSQAQETLIGIDKKVKTLKYNGYGEFVGKLYS